MAHGNFTHSRYTVPAKQMRVIAWSYMYRRRNRMNEGDRRSFYSILTSASLLSMGHDYEYRATIAISPDKSGWQFCVKVSMSRH